MPLDSLGLGLTLDTTLLEKADKTIENMHKNSKLIMQNLTRGISAFNSGAITDFADVLNNVQEALSKMDGTKMSIDYDKKGVEEYKRGINDILDLTVRLSEKFGDMKFYDPKRVNRTDESPREVRKRLNELLEEYKSFEAKLAKADEFDADSDKYTKQLTDSKAEIEKLTPSVEKLKEAYEKAKDAYQKYVDTQSKKIRKNTPEATDEEIQKVLLSRDAYIKKATAMLEAQKAYKEEESLLKAQQKLHGDASAAKFFSENRQELEENSAMLRESIKNAAADLAWANKTIAEKEEELLKDQKSRDNEEKSRIAGIQSTYKEIRKAIEQGEKELAEAEKRRDTIAKGKGDTSEYDAKIQELKAFLDEKKDIETSWRKSQYWPALEAIDKQFNKKKLEDDYKQRISSPTVEFANQYSKNATSIDEQTQAVKLLEAARNSLSDSTAHYDQVVSALNKRIAKHEDHIKLLTQEQKESKELQDSVISRYIREKKEIKELNKVLKELHEKQTSTGVKTINEGKYEQDIVARRQRLWNDVHQIEIDNAKYIAQLQEKFNASVAEERIAEIIKQNEREKQEYAKLLDDLYAIEKQKKAMEDAGGGVGDAAYDKLIQQEYNLNARKSQLESQHQNDLDEIRNAHEKKRNDDDVKAFIQAQKEKQRIAEQTQKELDAYNEKYGTVSQKNAEIAIESHKGAQNIAQHKQAIQDLQRVREKLDESDSQYYITIRKINNALKEHHKALKDAGVESEGLIQSQRGLMNIGGQLARRLSLVFSVSQLTQYFRKLVEVRGQFEKTETTLTSIIGDNQKAKTLMNQTISLAIKSPFTLQQLTGYTKQLAAYQVSYEELHETTKMLADVSAGLGVEMDRLILAFGQVKAANYLRATEVRQFTEAGFNILGELAKYYTDLEGKMVSVGDVQERVTKRMVDFGDVEEVFHRVTSAGGMFYDMQSKQAETLSGQWSNLQDKIDIMLNELGTDTEGLLKGFVSTLASLIDNWEGLADVIKLVVGAFALYKLRLLAVKKAQIQNRIAGVALIKAEVKQLGLLKGLKSAWKGLGFSMNFATGKMKNFMKANGPLLILTAIISAISAAVSHFEKLDEAVEENRQAFSESRAETKKISDAYSELNAKLAETTDREKRLAIIEEKRLKLQELAAKLKERGLDLTLNGTLIKDPTKIKDTGLDWVFRENKEILDEANKLGERLGEAIVRGQNAAQGTVFGWSMFGENLEEDAEDLAEAYRELFSHKTDNILKNIENDIYNNLKNLSEEGQKLYAELAEGRKAERNEEGEVIKWLESEYDWTLRRFNLVKSITWYEANQVKGFEKLRSMSGDIYSAEYEMSHELKGVLNRLVESYGSLEELKKAYKDNPQLLKAQIDTEIDKTAWSEEVKWFSKQRLYARVDIKPNYVEVVSTEVSQKIYEGFKKDLMDARDNLEKAGEGYSNFFVSTEDIDKMEQFTSALNTLQKIYDENIKKREQLKEVTTAEGQAELAMVNTLIAEVTRLAELWGFTLNTKKDDDGEDKKMKRLKEQISLIKEMNSEYKKLSKTFSKTEAMEKVRKAYADTAKELGLVISKMDFSDEGSIDSLQQLLKKRGYSAKKYAVEIQKSLDNLKVELDVEIKQEKIKQIADDIQASFDRYEITLDLKKLLVSSEFAKEVFDVEFLDFEGLKKHMIDQISSFPAAISPEVDKILEELDKIDSKKHTFDWANLEQYRDTIVKNVNGYWTIWKNIGMTQAEFEEYYKNFTANGEDPKNLYIATVEKDVKAYKQLLTELFTLLDKERQSVVNELNKEYEEIDWKGLEASLPLNLIEKVREAWKKLDEVHNESTLEKIKKYMEYSRGSLGEMAKIRLEYLQTVEDIDQAFKVEEGSSPKERKMKETEKSRALAEAKRKMDTALMNQDWEEFTSSEMFVTLLGDMEHASSALLDKVIKDIDKFRDTWKHLPLDEMEKVLKLRNEAERAKESEDGILKEKKRLRKATKGTTLEQAETQAYEATKKALELNKELENLQLIEQALNSGESAETLIKNLGLKEEYVKYAKNATDLQARLNVLLGKGTKAGEISVEQANQKARAANNLVDDHRDYLGILEQEASAYDELNKMAQDLYGAFKELFDASEGDEIVGIFADMGMQMLNTLLSTLSLQASLKAATTEAVIFGISLNSAMGVIGWIVMGVQLLTQAFMAAANHADELIKQEVERQTRALDEAIKKYEALEEAIEEAYSTEQLREYSQEMDVQLQKAIAAQKAIIKARESAKHAYEEGHEDWTALNDAKDELKELEDRAKENAKNIFSTLTDGILDSVHDAAREFTDAWYEAFKETGDGLSGLEENFDEMFLNLAKSQAAQQITGGYVQMWQDELKKVINPEEGDTKLTPEEAAEWAEKVKATFPELSSALEAFLGVISDGIGERGGLSELQKGIQGVTEQTAQVLESLLNSMRDTQANAYSELQTQTNILKDIKGILNDLTSASPKAVSVKMV